MNPMNIDDYLSVFVDHVKIAYKLCHREHDFLERLMKACELCSVDMAKHLLLPVIICEGILRNTAMQTINNLR